VTVDLGFVDLVVAAVENLHAHPPPGMRFYLPIVTLLSFILTKSK
jgi:hypothetical protein